MSAYQEAAVQRLDPSQNPDRLLCQSKVIPRVGADNRGTFYGWRKHGQFPPPDKVINGRPFWRESTVDAWIASK